MKLWLVNLLRDNSCIESHHSFRTNPMQPGSQELGINASPDSSTTKQ